MHSASLQENILEEDSIIALQDEEGATFIFNLSKKPKHHKRKNKQSCIQRAEYSH